MPAAQTLPGVPIVLGVVGHREIRPGDEQTLHDTVTGVLQEFREAYPQSPLVLLSALAEGADLIAAKAALAVAKNDVIGITVRAPIPFPSDIYPQSTSFDAASARIDFQMLQNDPLVEMFVVPMPEGETPRTIAEWHRVATDPQNRTLRRRCYANAGGYIVRHCHALIALWDGDAKPKDAQGQLKKSGTAEFVQFKLCGVPPAEYPWPEPLGYRGDCGPVTIIHTPRLGAQSARPVGERESWLPGCGTPLPHPRIAWRQKDEQRFCRRVKSALGFGSGPSELLQFQEICQLADDFNHDVKEAQERVTSRLGKTKIFKAAGRASSAQAKRRLSELAGLREAAGELAGSLDPKVRQLQLALFGTIFAAVVFFHLYTHNFIPDMPHPTHNPVFLLLFLVNLLGACALVGWVWFRRLDTRRLDYRALAEASRVRFFWGLAGIRRSVADSYLRQLRGEMAWARHALLHVSPPPAEWERDFAAASPLEKKRRMRTTWYQWVKEQKRYFKKIHLRYHHAAVRCRRIGLFLALAGWLICLFLLVNNCSQPTDPVTPQDAGSLHGTDSIWCRQHPNHWILIGSGLLVAGGGLWIAFGERRSYEELAKQYERMQVVFEHGNRVLVVNLRAGRFDEVKKTLESLGREAITEHAQWLILRRSRPFELHIGG